MTTAVPDLAQQLEAAFPGQVRVRPDPGGFAELHCAPVLLPDLCGHLFTELRYSFAGLVVEEGATEWEVQYLFYGVRGNGWARIRVNLPLRAAALPSIVRRVHAADWHEREAEDHFGLTFEGHPRLGDFVLHDDAWQEGIQPMRHSFNAHTPVTERRPRTNWRPLRVVQAPGSFIMPIGPIFAGPTESVHFALETVGEDVIRAMPRLFYKYRGIEKLAEGRSSADALVLAERFAATTAFAHAWAFSRAVEAIAAAEVPERARALRVFLAELERFRHHVGAIQAICASTALVVAESQVALLEEDLLRLCGALTGHRYLFGLAVPGGLAADLADSACREALGRCQAVLGRLLGLERMLSTSSSFLDRIEEVGIIPERDAREVGLVGPMARASNVKRDLRRVQSYAGYGQLDFEVPTEREGDGYARLRVLFAEARQSVRLMEQVAAALPSGPVRAPVRPGAGAALGYVEAPRGAAFHWVRLGENGAVLRYHVVPPSFINWLGFHLAVENFAFQDFPIILATLDLSVAETDR